MRSAEAAVQGTESSDVRYELRRMDQTLAEARVAAELEASGAEQKGRLVAQLRTQSARLTKAIVANEYLLDFEFVMCPRCGSDVGTDRASDGHCYLCLQRPHESSVGREDLTKEQDRIEQQIIETQDLVHSHQAREQDLRAQTLSLESRRDELSRELDFRTDAFVSGRASAIAEEATQRAEVRERLKRLRDYLSLFDKREQVVGEMSQLEAKEQELEAAIDAASSAAPNFEEHVRYLEETFRIVLDRFKVPHFRSTGKTGIDRKTYKPIVQGRPFDQLQSPGLVTLVNIAHALAHQLTAIEYDLPLPNILIMDGVSANLGDQGLDQERVDAVYDYLIEVGENHADRLQIIVADNSVPPSATERVRLELSEDDKLVPIGLLPP